MSCDCRKERQLNDYAYKVRRGMPSGVPGPLDTHGQHSQTSDTSDYQDGATLPSPNKQAGSSKTDKVQESTKKKVWRRKRRQSACKEDKAAREGGFSEKLVSSNRLARRQSLPPLTNMSPNLTVPQPPHQNLGKVEIRDVEVTAPQDVSRDSTPRPSHSHTPISPNGTLSPEVTELIDSVRNSFRHSHRRRGSTGSVEKSLRAKPGSKTASLEASPLKTNLQAHQLSSHQQQQPLSRLTSEQLGASSFSRHSPDGSISYLNLSSSDEEQPATPRHQFDDAHKEAELDNTMDVAGDGSVVEHLRGAASAGTYSNDSSPDTHGSDNEEEGNDADAEFTSDGASENIFGQFSGTEPNDTASPSSQVDSDELTSRSNPELSDAVSDPLLVT